MEPNKTTIQIEKNGIIKECKLVFTFSCEETMKTYIGYTDNEVAKNGRKNIYISAFNPFSPNWELEDIKTEKEHQMISEVLEYLDTEYSN